MEHSEYQFLNPNITHDNGSSRSSFQASNPSNQTCPKSQGIKFDPKNQPPYILTSRNWTINALSRGFCFQFIISNNVRRLSGTAIVFVSHNFKTEKALTWPRHEVAGKDPREKSPCSLYLVSLSTDSLPHTWISKVATEALGTFSTGFIRALLHKLFTLTPFHLKYRHAENMLALWIWNNIDLV